MELSGEIAASDDPDVPAVGSRNHLPVNRSHVTAHKSQIGAWNGR
jgi:hypothetical protein